MKFPASQVVSSLIDQNWSTQGAIYLGSILLERGYIKPKFSVEKPQFENNDSLYSFQEDENPWILNMRRIDNTIAR
jgi:hypothetical protein